MGAKTPGDGGRPNQLSRLGARLVRAWRSRGLYRAGAVTPPPLPVPARSAPVAESRPLLEALLDRNLLPFWFPETIDRELGGYRLDHDLAGRWTGGGRRRLIAQVRTLWFYAALVNAGRGTQAHLAAARHGYEFLRARLWDPDFGGFYWEVDATDESEAMRDKSSCGQVFALYALAEFAIASKDPEVGRFAADFFALLDEKAYDEEHGGYREMLTRDWRSVPAHNYVAAPADAKTMNTHLHLMEALECYHRASGDPRAASRLAELLRIMSRDVFRAPQAASTNLFTADWKPYAGGRQTQVSYGHDLENLWLLARAAATLGEEPSAFPELFRRIFEEARRYGYDEAEGGFYFYGSLGRPARGRQKVWWVQAEALVAALLMYQRTGERPYADCYLGTLEWIARRQVDWQHGDWHLEIAPNGRPMGEKAGPWKTPYHNGRALIECLALLDAGPGGWR